MTKNNTLGIIITVLNQKFNIDIDMKDKNTYYIDRDFIMVILNAQSKNLNSIVDKSQKCLGITAVLALLF